MLIVRGSFIFVSILYYQLGFFRNNKYVGFSVKKVKLSANFGNNSQMLR